MNSNDNLEITDGFRTLSLDKKQVLALELALNKSLYAYSYIDIGDHFFNFLKYPKGSERRPSSTLNTTKEQYDVLSKMHFEAK